MDVNVGMLPDEIGIKIDVLLAPNNPLNRDVRDLAGNLAFSNDEIQYVCEKTEPFLYLLDQWCKREGDNANMENLYSAIVDLKRPDVLELLEQAVKDVKEASFDQLHKLECKRNARMDRVDLGFVTIHEKASLHESRQKEAQRSTKDTLATHEEILPSVYIVHYPEDEEHNEHVRKLVSVLRSVRIDAKTDIFESLTASQTRPFYILSKLKKCDYIIMVCSPSMKYAGKILKNKKNNSSTITDKMKEMLFILRQIISDLYHKKSLNRKYIPVVLPQGNKSDIPGFLKTPKRYILPNDYDLLIRRIHQVETYALPMVTKEKKRIFRPRFIKST